MLLQKLMEQAGVHIEVRNMLVDYTLADGKSRAHNAYQILSNDIEVTDSDIVEQVRNHVPMGSRIAGIFEIAGDYELKELESLARSLELLSKEVRTIYLDEALSKEYIAEFK